MPRRITRSGSFRSAPLISAFFRETSPCRDGYGKSRALRVFFFFHEVHDFAPPAVLQFLSEGSLNPASAERTRYCPAGSSGIFSSMDSVKRLQGCHRADAEFRCFMSARWRPHFLYSQQFIFFMQSPQILFLPCRRRVLAGGPGRTMNIQQSLDFRKQALLKGFLPAGFYTWLAVRVR